MAICPKCGKNTLNGSFCGNCGISVYDGNNAQENKNPTNASTDNSPQITQSDIEALELAMKKNPTDPEKYVELAKAQFALKRLKNAYSTFRAARTLAPDNQNVLTIGAQILEAMGRNEEAAETLSNAFNNNLNSSEGILHLAELLYAMGKKEEALKWLGKALKQDAQNSKIIIKIAEIYLDLGNTEEAQKFLNHYKETAGASVELYVLMGKNMMARNFYDGAIKNFMEAKNAFPHDYRMILGLGKAYLCVNDKNKAMAEFEEALKISPNNIEILLELGKLYNSIGDKHKAYECFNEIEQNSRVTGDILYEIALSYKSKEENKIAIQYFQKTLAISPFNIKAQQNLGDLLTKEKQYKEALKVYKEAVSNYPDAEWAHKGIIATADFANDFEAKADSQKYLLKNQKDDVELWCDYGESLIKINNYDEAEKAFRKAAELSPTCKRAYEAPLLIKKEKAFIKGEELYKQAQEGLKNNFFISSADKIDRALKDNPNVVSWLKLRADIALKTADLKKSETVLSKLYELNSFDYISAEQLAKIYEFEVKTQDAIDILSQVIKNRPLKIDAQIQMLKLKRSLLHSTSIDAIVIDDMVKDAEIKLDVTDKNSPVPDIVKAYAHYIYSYKSRFQEYGIDRAEEIFKELSEKNIENEYITKGLLLCARLKGDKEQSIKYAKKLAKVSIEDSEQYNLARLYEYLQQYSDARDCYYYLKELDPNNPIYRRKIVELTAELSKGENKNELLNMLSELFKEMQKFPEKIWPIYETAIGQELAAQISTQKNDWISRSMLTWQKASNHPSANYWITWGSAECRLKNLTGNDKIKAANNYQRICDKILLENPNNPMAYVALAKCHLAHNDLSRNETALGYLEKAWFLAPNNADISLLAAQTAKSIGKSALVNAIGYNMALCEPETANAIFKL